MIKNSEFDFIYQKKPNQFTYNFMFYGVLTAIFLSIINTNKDISLILATLIFCTLAVISQKVKKESLKTILSYGAIGILYLALYLKGFNLYTLDFILIFIPMAFMWVFPGRFDVAIIATISIPFMILINKNPVVPLSPNIFRLLGVNYSAVIISILFRKTRKTLEFYKESLYLDELTTLPNRIALKDSLNRRIEEAQTKRKNLVFYQIDILKFQLINDSIGHKNGDLFLIDFSNRLKDFATEKEFNIFKIGGDEYILVQEQLPYDEELSISTAKELIILCNKPININNVELKVNVNIGIISAPEFCKTNDEVLNFSKKALDIAKKKGENKYTIFNESFRNNIERKRKIVEDLKFALALNHLELHYQPKISSKTNEIFGFEALIRWSHPRLGWISPLELITIAEEEGLIIDLGKWVIKESLGKLNYLQRNGYKNVRISANLSPSQLNDINLLEFLKTEYSKYNFQNNQYELELTESAMMKNKDSCIKVLKAIRELGIKISVDDFGIEFSSLSYIKELPLDVLKIDRFFIKDIKNIAEKHHVLDAIISLGKNLNLEIIAEGIETKEQLEYIRNACACGYQGFYFSKALPFNEAFSLLKHKI